MNLELEVRRILDRTEILETMHRYCRYADQLDGVSMAALFTDDCAAQYGPGAEPLRGRLELTQMLTTALQPVVSGSHHICNEEVLFDGPDKATLCCYMYSWQRFVEYPQRADCHRWGRYEIQAVSTDGGWRFHQLVLLSAGEYGGARIAEQLGRPFPPNFSAFDTPRVAAQA